MAVDTNALKVGDKIIVEEAPKDPVEMVVSRISPAGSAGRSYAAGPVISAHIRLGGYGITFDRESYHYPHVRLAEG